MHFLCLLHLEGLLPLLHRSFYSCCSALCPARIHDLGHQKVMDPVAEAAAVGDLSVQDKEVEHHGRRVLVGSAVDM